MHEAFPGEARRRLPPRLVLPGCVAVAALSVLQGPARAGDTSRGPGEGFARVGVIRPRHAREIRSSNWSVGAETMDRDFTVYANWKDYLGPLGVKKARIQSGWAKTEKHRGVYEWAWLDEIIPDMVEQGVEPWVCLCYGNLIYKGGGGTGLKGALPSSPEALGAWDRFVAAFVVRYRRHVDEYEIWNEPRGGRKIADKYAAFLVRTAETVRRRQPEAKILAMATAGVDLELVDGTLAHLRERKKLHLVDEVTYHPYSYNPDSSYGKVGRLRRLVRSYSKDITIRQGENGAPSRRGSYGALSGHDWTEELQAKWAARRLLGDLGRDIPSSYFAICDMHYTTRVNFKGLLETNPDRTVRRPKAAYRTVQHVAAVFDDTVKRIPDYPSRFTGTDARISAFGYEKAGGGQIVTVWRRDDAPGKRPEIERVGMALPRGSFDDPVWVDVLTGGVYDIDEPLWKRDGTGFTFDRLPVYDSVVLIAERRALPIAAPPASSARKDTRTGKRH